MTNICKPTPYTKKENLLTKKANIFLSQLSPYSKQQYCPPPEGFILQENGSFLLQENGFKIIL